MEKKRREEKGNGNISLAWRILDGWSGYRNENGCE